jgi:uncharacterized phage protein (TIGR02220 family)
MKNENIIKYLNKTSGKTFLLTEKINDLINSCFKEGHTPEDFKKAIDNICLEWIGTKYEKHIYPEKIFKELNRFANMQSMGEEKFEYKGYDIDEYVRASNEWLDNLKPEDYELTPEQEELLKL